jgi:hypothetical protein
MIISYSRWYLKRWITLSMFANVLISSSIKKKWEEVKRKVRMSAGVLCLWVFWTSQACFETWVCFSLANNSSENVRSNANSIDLNNEAFREYDVNGISAVSILLNNSSCFPNSLGGFCRSLYASKNFRKAHCIAKQMNNELYWLDWRFILKYTNCSRSYREAMSIVNPSNSIPRNTFRHSHAM